METFAKVVCNQNVRKRRNGKLVNEAMKHKVNDAAFDEKRMRRVFVRSRIEYSKNVRKGSMVDVVFNKMMKDEVEQIWLTGKLKNVEKVGTLLMETKT